MPLKKLCSYAGCNVLVDYGITYCSKHKAIAEQEKKQSWKDYKARRTDVKEMKFYDSKAWLCMRGLVLVHYNCIDLYEYYINNNIVVANTAHHIIELKDTDGWEHRLDFNNLFPCSSNQSHNTIGALYNRSPESKRKTQELLFNLIKRFEDEFKQYD